MCVQKGRIMMYHLKKIGIVTIGILFLTGCGSTQATGSRISANGNNVDSVLESQMAAANNSKSANNSYNNENNNEIGNSSDTASDENVDIDLTVMSSDMVYATVYQLMFESEDYVGKTVKMRGTYYATWYERTQKYYHCVIIKDATACCSQGLEFIWEDGNHIYPDEYPEDETEVEVTGEFEIYTEDGYEYCRLKDASLKVLD